MIKLLKNSEIDFSKYDECIKHSAQEIVYANSWYLDCTCDEWSCLVYDDYQAVMPISYLKTKRNLYRKKVYQPSYSQQLGIFSYESLPNSVLKEFIESFLALSPKSYHFNFGNSDLLDLGNFKLIQRVNYELGLGRPYAQIKEAYSKNLQRNIKKAVKNDLRIEKELSIADYILLKKNAAEHGIKSVHFKVLSAIVVEATKRGMAEIYGVYHGDFLVAGAVCLNDGNRIIHLSSASDSNGKSLGATPYLFDQIIEAHANSNMTFDFEGSMLEGVARFFKSFGSQDIPYFKFEN